MSQASIYLHPPLVEHFGIAIVLRRGNRPRARGLQGRGRVDWHSFKNWSGPWVHERWGGRSYH